MSSLTAQIRARLQALTDPEYREFLSRLLPNVAYERILGVRTPDIRLLASEYAKHAAVGEFLQDLPHCFYEENNLHALILERTADFDRCIAQLEVFLPQIDNWGTCDTFSPKVFRKNPEKLLRFIWEWIDSQHPYTVRFGIRMLMNHFLDSRFDPAFLIRLAGVRSQEYYVNTMVAWYFATALAKQYADTVKIFEIRALPAWTHNKAIQKACESFRVLPEHKTQLREMRIPSAQKR